eukprot:SM000219S06665  [mRNA]  locus=s219:82152:85099:+ [translate_table: standard]
MVTTRRRSFQDVPAAPVAPKAKRRRQARSQKSGCHSSDNASQEVCPWQETSVAAHSRAEEQAPRRTIQDLNDNGCADRLHSTSSTHLASSSSDMLPAQQDKVGITAICRRRCQAFRSAEDFYIEAAVTAQAHVSKRAYSEGPDGLPGAHTLRTQQSANEGLSGQDRPAEEMLLASEESASSVSIILDNMEDFEALACPGAAEVVEGALSSEDIGNVKKLGTAVEDLIVPLSNVTVTTAVSGSHIGKDPLLASEYVEDMYTSCKDREGQSRLPHDYLKRHGQRPEINERMRAILIDWLIEVHLRLEMMPETLYLTVQILDRYLAKEVVHRSNLQLAGVTALLVASKYEEVNPCSVAELVDITSGACGKDDLLASEVKMLNALEFALGVPTVYTFLQHYLLRSAADSLVATVSTYMVDLTLQQYSMLHFSPSCVAAAALHNAHVLVKQTSDWRSGVATWTGYTDATLRPCAEQMLDLQHGASNGSLVAVYRKYCLPQNLHVAHLACPMSEEITSSLTAHQYRT